ncbi:MAG TPA: gliding motility-associated C-terminal domain-containing protein, partial [Puia sp.]|nr:gliding motility-associated C-terminal domain-containing protein [Puia sp.]
TNVTVVINPLPTVTISSDTTVCEGHPANLTASGGITYAWTALDNSVNSSGPAITPSPIVSTRYYVLVTDVNGCSSLDSVDVTAHRVPVFSVKPLNPIICINDSLQLIASGGNTYVWTDPGGQQIGQDSSIFIVPGGSGSYQVQVTDLICRQTGTLTVPVVVNLLPAIEVTKSNDLDCSHGQATLEASGAISYQWADIPGISDLTIPDPVVRPSLTTTYYVKGTDRNGCSSIDSISVLADFASDPSHYPVASAFTPNNDGNNDCFGLKNWGRVTSLEFSMFNRWGQRVFFTTDPQQCWDGTYKGIPQPAGGYAYLIKAATVCGTAFRKGVVMLIR